VAQPAARARSPGPRPGGHLVGRERAEPRNGHMIGGVVGSEDPEGDVFDAAAFDLPGGAHPPTVAIQQHAEQQEGLVAVTAQEIISHAPFPGRKLA
jgi:hypothetical protein